MVSNYFEHKKRHIKLFTFNMCIVQHVCSFVLYIVGLSTMYDCASLVEII